MAFVLSILVGLPWGIAFVFTETAVKQPLFGPILVSAPIVFLTFGVRAMK